MVKEYIEQQMQLTKDKILELEKELEQTEEMEKIVCKNIREVRDSDVNFEIFSPRRGGISLRDKMRDLDHRLRNIRAEKAAIEERLEALKIEESNFEMMMEELGGR